MKDDPIIKAKELIDIIKYFHSLKRVELPEGMKCPLDTGDDEVSHYDLSQAAFGLGLIYWTCKFCGEWFSD